MKVGAHMNIINFFKSKNSSGSVAKDRLKLVLIHDRLKLSPDVLETLRLDLIEVISRYMVIDEEDVDIHISPGSIGSAGNDMALSANIPIKAMLKHQE